MKDYDLIVIGTGSGMNYVNSIIDSNPKMKIAVIDKDEPAGSALHGDVSLQSFCFTLQNLSGILKRLLFSGSNSK
jgi:hypothetical protein